MKPLNFNEIRNIVHDICREVDAEHGVEVQDAIAKSCQNYFSTLTVVWQAAMGMRFNCFGWWEDAEQSLEGCEADWTMDDYLFIITHECLRLMVEDAHANGHHFPHYTEGA